MAPELTRHHDEAAAMAYMARRFDFVPQYSGRNVHYVELDRGDRAGFNSKGAAAIDFHNDAYDYPSVPPSVGLYCLEADCDGGHTFYSPFQPAFSGLAAEDQVLLAGHRFEFLTEPARHHGRTDLGVTGRIASAGTLRYSYGYLRRRMAEDDSTLASALDRLNARLHAARAEVTLRPGELMILDNIVAVHGRTAYQGRRRLARFWLRRR